MPQPISSTHGLLAGAAAFAVADDAADRNIGAGLGEGEERREESCLHGGAEEDFHGLIQRAFEVAESDVDIYG